jgi:hypothetical protein
MMRFFNRRPSRAGQNEHRPHRAGHDERRPSCVDFLKNNFHRLVCFALAFVLPLIILIAHKPASQGAMRGGYATLIIDESQNDAEICALLSKHGIDNYISESTQRFFLNDFESVKQIPLADYKTRLLDSDPRNDGYAEKLRTLFLTSGQRRIYIPTSELSGFTGGGLNAGGQNAEARITQALEGMPYKALVWQNVRQDNTLFIILFFCVALFVFLATIRNALLKKNPMLKTINMAFPAQIAALLPSFAIVACSGVAGFALCAIYMAIFQIFRRPLLDLFINCQPGPPDKGNARSGKSSFASCLQRRLLRVEKKQSMLIIAEALIVIAIALCISGGIGAFQAAAGFVCFIAAWFSSSWALSKRDRETAHVRFMRLPLYPEIYPQIHHQASLQGGLSLHGFKAALALPWTIAAVLALVLSLLISAGPDRAAPQASLKNSPSDFVSEEDYRNHIAFQQNFAMRRLSPPAEEGGGHPQEAYLRYRVDENGLFHEGEPWTAPESGAEFPPFPLRNLLAFLQTDHAIAAPVAGAGQLAAILISLLEYVVIVVLLGRRLGHRKSLSFRLS